ncbi:hypothetical protein ACFXTI_034788 [Malus domestica]
MNVYSSVGLVESASSFAPYEGSIRYLVGPIGNVHCPNARLVAGRVAACRDAAGKVRLPLSYFEIPRPGHVGSRCVAKVDSPRLSVVQGHSSTL